MKGTVEVSAHTSQMDQRHYRAFQRLQELQKISLSAVEGIEAQESTDQKISITHAKGKLRVRHRRAGQEVTINDYIEEDIGFRRGPYFVYDISTREIIFQWDKRKSIAFLPTIAHEVGHALLEQDEDLVVDDTYKELLLRNIEIQSKRMASRDACPPDARYCQAQRQKPYLFEEVQAWVIARDILSDLSREGVTQADMLQGESLDVFIELCLLSHRFQKGIHLASRGLVSEYQLHGWEEKHICGSPAEHYFR